MFHYSVILIYVKFIVVNASLVRSVYDFTEECSNCRWPYCVELCINQVQIAGHFHCVLFLKKLSIEQVFTIYRASFYYLSSEFFFVAARA